MKARTITAVLSATLLFASTGSQSLAQLSGSDDFNDNIRDPGKWDAESALFQESNGRLEFSNTGTGTQEDSWAWIKNTGSYLEDWVVTLEVFNAVAPSSDNQSGSLILAVVNDADDSDIFGVGFEIGRDPDWYRAVHSGWFINGIPYWGEGGAFSTVDASSITLRIAFDAATKTLTSSWNGESGFSTLTNFNCTGWSMGSSDSFVVAIAGESINMAVSSGQLYADNFQTISGSSIADHLDFVFIGHIHEYEPPFWSGGDQYEFDCDVDTDDSVASVSIVTPGSEILVLTNYYDDGYGYLEWEYSAGSSSSLMGRFSDGDYTVEIIYTNGTSEATIIPFAAADGTTPLANVTSQPLFIAPDPLHDALFSPTSPFTSSTFITLHWGEPDPNANMVDLHRHYVGQDDWESLGLFTDLVPFAEGPFSTRSVGPISFTQGVWGVELFIGNATYQTNSDGVIYVAIKEALSEYSFTVLEGTDDEDSDGMLNWWEVLYFAGPTNAAASLDSDQDGHNNLMESITGMDPTNSASVFMITNSMPLADGFLIEWPSVSGRVYNTYWSTNLMDGFKPMGGNIDYPQSSYTDTLHGTEAECFYRLDVRKE